MKANFKSLCMVGVAMVAVAACGGSGDDNAGQSSEFQVSPKEVKLTSVDTTCPNGKAGDFLVIGGTAPYTAYSSFDSITFGPAGSTAPTSAGTYEIANRNNRFSIFVSSCMSPGIVTVLDKLQRVTTISVTAAASGAS